MKSLREPVRISASFGLLVVLAGCTSVAPRDAAPKLTTAPAVAPAAEIPAARAVIPPPAQPATLLGSEETSPLLDNFTVYLAALDGVALAAGREGWNQPVRLAPGPHRLVLAFVRGVFHASAEVAFTAAPATPYEIRHLSDAQVYGKRTFCEFWIVNKNTGEQVTGVVRAELKRLSR